MGCIEDGWINFDRNVLPDEKERARGQTRECRRAFFAGALIGYTEVTSDISPEKLESIRDELSAYWARLVDGRE